MMKFKNLTRKSFESALKKIEEDAGWSLRNPRIEVYHHQDIKKLKKAGFFRKRNE